MKDYMLAEVDAAEQRIREACPTALINRWNYDWNLSVARADRSVEMIVFCVPIHEQDGPTVIGDVDAIIAILTAPSICG